MAQRIVYWFRNDLRLNDNEALYTAAANNREVIPVYVFDPRQFENMRLGFRRTGALRAQFQIECVIDLRNRLREKGGDLIVRIGEPEKIIAELAEKYQAEYVFTSKEIAPEETRMESSLSKRLKISNIDIKLFWMDTLIQVTDLPFQIAKLPMGFQHFQNQIMHNLQIKEPLPAPDKVNIPLDLEAGIIPSLPMLGIDPQEIKGSGINDNSSRRGGETMALAKMDEYIKNSLQSETDPDSVDLLTDSQLSNWLSQGCISARSIYKVVTEKGPKTKLTDTLLDNLLARDYFHWTLLRYGPRLFKPSGIRHNFDQQWLNDIALFETWSQGKTEDEKVNLIMKKLLLTGDLSSRERKTSAAFLVKTMKLNWTWGAMYFESFLIDYDVSVNWGKWNNMAGVGPD